MLTPDLRRTLFERLIDDAGLFPPVRLAMPEALAGHAANRVGPLAWVQGRFIVPASKLPEVVPAWPGPLSSLRLAVVADAAGVADADAFSAALDADLAAAAALERREGRIRVELVEVRLPDAGLVQLVAPAVRRAGFAGPVTALLESPDSTDVDAVRGTVAAVAAARAAGAMRVGAKIRTGGLEPAMIPPPAAVAAFLGGCVTAGVPFKATAGLHHPVRGIDPPSGMQLYGFVNLLAATALLRAGRIDERHAVEVLTEEDAAAFIVRADAFGWRRHAVDGPAVAAVRTDALTAYGSCSFEEPTADLAALGWLP